MHVASPPPVADPPAGSALPAAPVGAGERLLTLDVLRGMALLWILMGNVWAWFSGLFLRIAELRPQLMRLTPDGAAHHLIAVFVSARGMVVFAFLFGVGLAVQMLRARARGTDIAPLYRRRMAVLLAIGVAHGVLLWYGDILAVYAVLGLVLLHFRGRSDRTLLAWAAAVLVVIPIALTAWAAFTPDATPAAGAAAAAAARRAATLDAFQSADPRRVIAENLRWIRGTYSGPAAINIVPPAFGCFLLGLWAGRRRILERVPAHAAAFRRTMIWGLGVGIASSVAHQVLRGVPRPGGDAWMAVLLGTLHVLALVPLAAGYASAVVLLLERPAWKARLAVFAPMGRMALTNYLAQTVLCLAIFYGGGLVGRVGVAAALGISLAVFAVQMAWSRWWLARHHFGPVEWAWRSLTYGRAQPMRIRTRDARPGVRT